MKAKDVMTRAVIHVDKDDRLPTVLEMMKKGAPSKFPVMEDGKLAGILIDGDIADELGATKNRGVATAQLRVTTAMRRHTETAAPDTPLAELLFRMLDKDTGMMPVVENGKILGVVTASDLVKRVTSERPVSEFMTTRLFTVTPTDRVIHARRLMLDHHVERLPVTDGGKLVGIVGERDVAMGLWDFRERVPLNHQGAQLKEFLVQHVMRTQVVTIDAMTTAAEAAQRMVKEDVGSLPVTQGDRVTGIITRTDLLRLLDI